MKSDSSPKTMTTGISPTMSYVESANKFSEFNFSMYSSRGKTTTNSKPSPRKNGDKILTPRFKSIASRRMMSKENIEELDMFQN
jgi:hypothetical protein